MSEDDGSFKRYEVWLDERGQETIEHLRAKYGSTASGAFRVGLELIRAQLGLSDPRPIPKLVGRIVTSD